MSSACGEAVNAPDGETTTAGATENRHGEIKRALSKSQTHRPGRAYGIVIALLRRNATHSQRWRLPGAEVVLPMLERAIVSLSGASDVMTGDTRELARELESKFTIDNIISFSG